MKGIVAFRRRLVVLAIWFTLGCASSAHGDIELPFDYFHGRWVDGHLPTALFRWQKGTSPDRTWGYSFGSGGYRAGFWGFQDQRFPSADDRELRSPAFFCFLRPRSNWQIGIDAFQHKRTNLDLLLSGDSLGNGYRPPQYNSRSRTDLVVSSHWQSRSTIALSMQKAAFHYYLTPLVGHRLVRLDNVLHLHWDASDRGIRREDPPGWSSRSSHGTAWSSDNAVAWGIAPELELQASLSGRGSVDLRTSCAVDPRRVPGYTLETQRSTWRSFDTRYAVRALATPFRRVLLRSAFGQGFAGSERQETTVALDGSDSAAVSWDEFRQDLGEDRRSCSLSVDYLSLGEFDPGVVLDDYERKRPLQVLTSGPVTVASSEGFYRRMLFHRQWRLRAGISYTRYGSRGDERSRYTRLTLMGCAGLWNKLQVDLDWSYDHRKSGRARPEGQYSVLSGVRLSLAYRSFTYRPGAGPGWKRDSRSDVVYGSVLAEGQMVAELRFAPPIPGETIG